MDTNLMIQTLQDPMGVPFYPVVFQGLSILTFALHILFVNLVLGGALIAAWGYFSSDQRWQKLSRMLAKVTTINISIAIVLGVAPLLFVQVIYDPFWYTSNLLSAWWAMLFLAALIPGARTAAQVEENVRASGGPGLAPALSEELARIQAAWRG